MWWPALRATDPVRGYFSPCSVGLRTYGAAVDHQSLPGDRFRHRGDEKERGVSNIFRHSPSPEGVSRSRMNRWRNSSIDATWRHGVDSNTQRAQFEGKDSRQLNDGSLRSSVVGALAPAVEDAGMGRDVDNRACAVGNHHTSRALGAHE